MQSPLKYLGVLLVERVGVGSLVRVEGIRSLVVVGILLSSSVVVVVLVDVSADVLGSCGGNKTRSEGETKKGSEPHCWRWDVVVDLLKRVVGRRGCCSCCVAG